mmetsp:Transcript_14390/g.29798  ORF Transcript_14390/g.29798 Transcript_14390/m.29798 type:complete len:233 (+) Transcript_14390:2500-3198(+)
MEVLRLHSTRPFHRFLLAEIDKLELGGKLHSLELADDEEVQRLTKSPLGPTFCHKSGTEPISDLRTGHGGASKGHARQSTAWAVEDEIFWKSDLFLPSCHCLPVDCESWAKSCLGAIVDSRLLARQPNPLPCRVNWIWEVRYYSTCRPVFYDCEPFDYSLHVVLYLHRIQYHQSPRVRHLRRPRRRHHHHVAMKYRAHGGVGDGPVLCWPPLPTNVATKANQEVLEQTRLFQ